MKTELSYYDIFPKVVSAGMKAEITIRPLGDHVAFPKGDKFTVTVAPIDERLYPFGDIPSREVTYEIYPDDSGDLRFSHTFETESCYILFVADTVTNKRVRFNVYAVGGDLDGKYPFIGDLHVHSCRSDGREDPVVIPANLRKCGYDFTVISEHRRNYPSLEAIRADKGVPIDMCIVQGEEVHLPGNPYHIINFGGKYSVNAMVDGSMNSADAGKSKKVRSTDPALCPDIISEEEYKEKIEKIASGLDVPDYVPRFSYAACKFITDNIKRGEGLAVFVHPYWIDHTNHVPTKVSEYILESGMFDAFEVLGGERYFAQNGFQTVLYYQETAKGCKIPIVGSSDSHGTINNVNFDIAKTIVFSAKNDRKSIIDAVKDRLSVAVDCISAEYRLVGDLRLVRYADFLMNCYFPLHDELCYEEGRLMKDYVSGTPDEREEAARLLKALRGRTDRMRSKYFKFKK